VDSWHHLKAESGTLLERTGIPRRVLSRLLTATGIGVGYSILDIGCGAGELVGYFDSLGIRSAGIDETARNVMDARRNVPDCEFYRASIDDPWPSLQAQFDLILIRDSSAYQGGMLSRPAFVATSRLLARIRPGGHLAFLTHIEPSESATTSHQISCFDQHLSSLPGDTVIRKIPDRRAVVQQLRSLVTRGMWAGYGIAILQPPRLPLTQAEWMRAADAVIRADHAPCCQWATRSHESTRYRAEAA
jgi:SAM-dependent methyltransferase